MQQVYVFSIYKFKINLDATPSLQNESTSNIKYIQFNKHCNCNEQINFKLYADISYTPIDKIQ